MDKEPLCSSCKRESAPPNGCEIVSDKYELEKGVGVVKCAYYIPIESSK